MTAGLWRAAYLEALRRRERAAPKDKEFWHRLAGSLNKAGDMP